MKVSWPMPENQLQELAQKIQKRVLMNLAKDMKAASREAISAFRKLKVGQRRTVTYRCKPTVIKIRMRKTAQ